MSTPASSTLPVPSARANAATPRGSPTPDEVELGPVQNGTAAPAPPLEEDIMQCARIGAIEHIQKMIESGKIDPKYQDDEGITPLHWAAINNQYAVCKYLIDHGSDVNAKGGESGATPAMWAAQRCHYYIVNLLLNNKADPLATDGQGYNILHLATIDGNALLLILLLQQDIPVDVADPQGHTALMWAGYKGWPACVDLLLRWGADINAIDDNGFTPLHWALVKGSKPCLDKLLDHDANRFAKTNEGKTPATCAAEMNTSIPWVRSLSEHGYGPDANIKTLPFNLHTVLRNSKTMSRFYFFYPFLILWIALYIISHNVIYIGIPLAFATWFAMQYAAQYAGAHGPVQYRQIHKTPYLSGIFAGTLFFVGICFLFLLLPVTYRAAPFSSLLFTIFFSSTGYFYFLSMLEDPGFIPKLSSRNQQREVIQELFSLWKFDEDSFCTQCLIRKPLRSKHCRRCGRCVAKQDHHCPWINSCVANNNIRHFFIYVLSLEIGIFIYIHLVLIYLASIPAPPASTTCNILTPDLCSWVLRDPWTVALTLWTLLQLVWVTMLIVVQSIQISKNMTTFENMKRHDHGDNHSHLPTHRHVPTNTTNGPLSSSSLTSPPSTTHTTTPPHRAHASCLTKLKRTIGLDVFLATASDASQGKMQGSRGNPFSRGIIGNCKDFWCDPAPIFGQRHNGDGYLGGEVVDYTKMFEAPLMRYRRRGGGGGAASAAYERVAGGDDDDDDGEEV